MNKYYDAIIDNLTEFLEDQKQKHINLEEVNIDGVDEKIENLNSEVVKSNELIDSLESVSKPIEEINIKLTNELIKSFTSFKDYISNEIGEESIDFAFMEDARKRFVNEFNNNIENFSKSLLNAQEDPKIFINVKAEIIDIFFACFNNFSEQIDEYINFLEEKKENIMEILQKESNIKNKISPFKNQEFSQLPSYQPIIDLEEQVEKIKSLEISKLLEVIKKERSERTNNEVEDKNV